MSCRTPQLQRAMGFELLNLVGDSSNRGIRFVGDIEVVYQVLDLIDLIVDVLEKAQQNQVIGIEQLHQTLGYPQV